jgi:hypothetical protein
MFVMLIDSSSFLLVHRIEQDTWMTYLFQGSEKKGLVVGHKPIGELSQ